MKDFGFLKRVSNGACQRQSLGVVLERLLPLSKLVVDTSDVIQRARLAAAVNRIRRCYGTIWNVNRKLLLALCPVGTSRLVMKA